jgi:hypothetical protein
VGEKNISPKVSPTCRARRAEIDLLCQLEALAEVVAGGFSLCLAATNNCLAQSNKSRTGGKATKKRKTVTNADPLCDETDN